MKEQYIAEMGDLTKKKMTLMDFIEPFITETRYKEEFIYETDMLAKEYKEYFPKELGWTLDALTGALAEPSIKEVHEAF